MIAAFDFAFNLLTDVMKLKLPSISAGTRIVFAALALVLLGFVMGFFIRNCAKKDLESPDTAKLEPSSPPVGLIKEINGVDLSQLTPQQQKTALEILNEIPCLASAGTMSIARCRRDVPDCVTSQRMADFIIDRILKGYKKEEVIVALYDKALKERRAKTELKEERVKVPMEGLPFLGSSNASVTVFLYFDYEGAISRKALESAEKLINFYPDKVKVVYCPMPFSRTREDARAAARIALASANLGGFQKVHELLLKNDGKAGEDELAYYAENSGLSGLIEEASSQKVINLVSNLESVLASLGMGLPPVFFVQGRRVEGPVPELCFLMDAVQQELALAVRAKYRSIEERIAPLESFLQ